MAVRDSAIMNIADVHFAIRNEINGTLPDPDPAYRSFLMSNDSVCRHGKLYDISIRLCAGAHTKITNLEKIHDNGSSWQMFKDGDDYVMINHARTFEQPFWVARMSHQFTCITVSINDVFNRIENGRTIILNPVRYPLDQILLMYFLAPNKGLIVHAAGINIHEKGYLFPGKSGAGKSTIAQQFFGKNKTKLLSDDRIIIRKNDGGYAAYGTPWPGEAGIALNDSMPLSGIFFINHGSTNRIKTIKPKKALERLFPVTSIPWYDRDVMPNVLDFCEDLVFNVPAYELDFKPSVEVVDVFEKFISGL